jgi:MFS family permease
VAGIEAGSQATDRDLALQRRRVILSGVVGTTLEWFDFLLYGLMAPSVFDRLFFPQMGGADAQVVVLAIYAAGYAARPLGAVVFGHFGDRIGRKPTLYVSLAMMGGATALMGLLPTHAAIGPAAGYLLVLMRALQGFALGGEVTGVAILATENGPAGGRGAFTSFVQIGGALGSVAASLAAALVARLPEAALLTWGWRLPFLASGILVLVGIYVRRHVAESPVFLAAMTERPPARVPLAALLRREGGTTLVICLCTITQSSMLALFSIFALVYGIGALHASRADLLDGILIGNAVGCFAMPVYGRLSDRIGRRPLIIASLTIAPVFAALVYYPLLSSGDHMLVRLVTAIPPALIQPMIFAITASYFSELIRDSRLRFTGIGFGGSVGSVIGGAFPAIAGSLLSATGTIWGPLSFYAVLSVVSITTVLAARETRDVVL